MSALRAGATLLATLLSFATVYALCVWCGAGPQPAILAAILAIGVSRRARPARGSRVLFAPLVVCGITLAAGGVGWLLHARPLVGAGVFVAGMFVSVWLRNFGERARTAGALIALPFVGMLVAPGVTNAPGGPLVDFALIAGAGLVSLTYATAIQGLFARVGMPLIAERPAEERPASEASTSQSSAAQSSAPQNSTERGKAAKGEAPQRAPRRGVPVPTRMALQMAVALAAAFAVGFLAFPGHWSWAVLTAFIVCSGARGRGDAAYKGVLRLIGALAGTLAAAALAYLWAPSGVAEAVTIFVILYFGLWLREVNYAYWACAMTLILAMLSRSNDTSTLGLLGARLEAILAGALCAVAAAWFVFPIRTEAVIRRRLADALAALDELVAHAHVSPAEATAKHGLFEWRMAELESVAHPVRWHKRVFARGDVPEHPARWVELASGLGSHASALRARGGAAESSRGKIRRAITASRRAIANHGKPDAPATIGAALSELHVTLAQTSAPGSGLGAVSTAGAIEAIVVDRLVKRYGDVEAVAGLSFSVPRGAIFGLLGRNGAGKTTTLECCIGLGKPTSGSVKILGLDPTVPRELAALRPQIGVQLQSTSLPEKAAVGEVLELYAAYYGVPPRAAEMARRVGLEGKLDRQIAQMSGGEQQRLALALALQHDPEVVFLDEPTAGMDAFGRRIFWAEVEALRKAGKTIVLTTHYIEEAERLCDTICIVQRGKIVAEDTPENLVTRYGGDATVCITADGFSPDDALRGLGTWTQAQGEWQLVTRGEPGLALAAVVTHANAISATVRSLDMHRPELEDAFIAITGETIGEGE